MTPYEFTEDALADVDALWEYISLENLDAADRVVSDLLDACEQLGKMPGLGHTREDLTDRPLRFWPVGRYLVIYRPDRKPIHIIAVLHGARDVPAILDRRETQREVELANQPKRASATMAPSPCPSTNPRKSAGRIPLKVSVAARAIVTAGFANEVEDVNQYAAVM